MLLGEGFQQTVLTLDYGSVTEQVARATGHSSVDLAVWFQKGASGVFGTMSVQGTHVQKCLGYRVRRNGQAPEGHMFFIDARACGKPICARIFETSIFRVEDFLDELGVLLPARYEARFSGGEPVGGDPLVLKFLPCTSVLIWIVYLPPDLPILEDAEQSGDDEPDEDGRDDDTCERSSSSSRRRGSGTLAVNRKRPSSAIELEADGSHTHREDKHEAVSVFEGVSV